MSKASDAANAVVWSVEQICKLYGVKTLRMQSRVMWVPGAASRPRPMFFGKWTDDNGKEHKGGMADLLARVRIPHIIMRDAIEERMWIETRQPERPRDHEFMRYITVPLWIECKSGKGKMSPDQLAFKKHVEANGEYFLLIHDDTRPLEAWFQEHGIARIR